MKVLNVVGVGAILILALMAGVFIVDSLTAGAASEADVKLAPAVEKAESDAAKMQLEELKKRGYTPLKVKLPPPTFKDTPEDLKSANLEANPEAKRNRKPFYAPKELRNVALKKRVTASDDMPVVGELELITDGEKLAYDGYYVELGPGLQWVQLDLEQAHEIFAVVVWHYHQKPCIFKDMVVKYSDDPDFVKGAKTLFNNDHDNSAGLGVGKQKEYIEYNVGKLIDSFVGPPKDGKGVKARYLRFYSNGSTYGELNQYIEIEVWGRPVK